MSDDHQPSNPLLATSTDSGARASCPGARGILALALLLGLLRFWNLGEWSLWVDEAYTVADWGQNLGRGQIWNPLGYHGIRAMVDFLGGEPTEWNLRLLPAIAGWLCIPLAYWALRESFGAPRAAWVALLLALSSWHIFWSQSARFYTMAMALSLLGSGVLLRGLWRGQWLPAMLGLVITAAAVGFHPTAALVAGAMALAPLLLRLRGATPGPGFERICHILLVVAGVGALFAARWLWTSFEHHQEQKGVASMFVGPVHLLLTSGFFFTPLVGAAALVGAIWSWRARDAAGLFATAVCVLAMGGALLISAFALMTAQYTFCLLPWALAVALSPLEALAARVKGRGLVLGWCTVLTLSSAAGVMLYMTSRMGERPRWREAYALVDSLREPGDLVLGMAASIGELYLGETGADPKRTRVVSPLGDWFPYGPARWNRYPRRIWVVVRPQWYPSLRDADRRRLEQWLAEECHLVKRLPVQMEGRDMELLVYLREP